MLNKTKQFLRIIRENWSLIRSPLVPLRYKLIPLFSLFYIIHPIDLLPDFFVIPGILDDFTIFLFTQNLFHRFTRNYHPQAST